MGRLQSHTAVRHYAIKVLFTSGKVVRVGADENVNQPSYPMKTYLLPAGAALLLALFVTGCESDGGVSSRAQEKSATYAALKPWQKKYIDKGAVADGFTADMVYIAMGKPDKVDTKDLADGHAEMWTYNRFYPSVDAVHGFHHADFTTESAYQPQRALTETNNGGTKPAGMSREGGASAGSTGGPQGGSMEPADLSSYTVKILFANGKVVRMGADVNP